MKLLKTALMLLLSACAAQAATVRQPLDAGWKFRQQRLENWYDATVPGTVHTDLMANGIIEDPFFRLNERGVQWIDKEDWIYKTSFVCNPDIFGKERIELVFEGLDTYADVYLNDSLVLKADNMFRRWRTDAKPLLKNGENELKIYFHSPIKVDMPKWESLPYRYPCANDQSANGGLFDRKLSIFARKAGYHYGWDWGPRLVTSGIWRPVYLEAWDDARISDVFYNQKSVTAKRADVDAEIEIAAVRDGRADVRIVDNDTGKVLASASVSLSAGTNKAVLPFCVKNPQLWWSSGLGDPHRYAFRAEISFDGNVCDSKILNVGLRSLKLVRENDDAGRTFYFELNGAPVFAKGANYIPCDNFLPRVTRAVYEKTVQDAVAANMNMLRVWGGGVYEDDYFYELCDRNGIMVWQDFMFACSLYPAEGAWLESVKLEAADNIRRLRNYACIALWCGNNECNDVLQSWKKRYAKRGESDVFEIMRRQFDIQYYEVLPSVVAEYDPMRAYHPCSPWSREDVRAERNCGDCHYWGVWHSRHPLDNYNTVRSRFFSEYGFQSFPEFASIKRYAPEECDWSIYSEVMMSHQRGGTFANRRINDYLEDEYWPAKDFRSFIYMNQVLQGDAIKTAIEAHRCDMPYCMGSLFWQHNDCWPVASWASRDYYGRWKAQHYFARKAFADILVHMYNDDGRMKIFVVSDRPNAAKGTLAVEVMDFDGNIVARREQKIVVAPRKSSDVMTEPLSDILGETAPENVFVAMKLMVGDKVYTNNGYFVKQKYVAYPAADVTATVRTADGGVDVTLTADKFARAVFMSVDGIDNFFEDNYFDMLPATTRTVHVSTPLSADEFAKQLQITHLAQMK